MYVHTSFRSANTCKIGEKGCIFGHVHKFWKGHDKKIREKSMQKHIFRVYFHTWKICALGVF